jgi:hypothetical protein
MAYSPCDQFLSHQHIPAQTFRAVLLILGIYRTQTTFSSDTVSYNRSVYPFRAPPIANKTHIVTVLAIQVRKLQATEQGRCHQQTWTTRPTKAIGTLASNATRWSATISARHSVVNRLSRRMAPILRRLRHTPSRTNRTSRTAKVAKLLNARTSVLDVFQNAPLSE